jgi:hypothetical protein
VGAYGSEISPPLLQNSSENDNSLRHPLLYLYLEHHERIYLLHFYGKDEQSDLSPNQKKVVAQLARMIKEAFSKLELSLNQALAHARGEQGDFKEKNVAAPLAEKR